MGNQTLEKVARIKQSIGDTFSYKKHINNKIQSEFEKMGMKFNPGQLDIDIHLDLSATIQYKDFSLDANIAALDFLPLPLKITHGLIGSIKIELPNITSFISGAITKSAIDVKNSISVKRIFLNLETTNH